MKKLIRKISNFLFLAAIPVWIIALIVNFYYSPWNTLKGLGAMVVAIVVITLLSCLIIYIAMLVTGRSFALSSQEERSDFIDSLYVFPFMMIVVSLVDGWFLGPISGASFLVFWCISYITPKAPDTVIIIKIEHQEEEN